MFSYRNGSRVEEWVVRLRGRVRYKKVHRVLKGVPDLWSALMHAE